jgi:hypothetical protein
MAKRRTNDQWLNAVQECRSSGLTDRAWCDMNGIHPTTFYRAIRRLRKKACDIPMPSHRALSLPQEVVEVASVDENGIITQLRQTEPASVLHKNHSLTSYNEHRENPIFVASACIVTPSGIKVEVSNNTNTATIRNILGALQSL